MNFTMQETQKLFMDRDGFQLHFGFDFQKATDETERTVVGFATLDNLDQTGDIVLAKASEDAFRTFRGNIRAQHNKHDAVGRMVAFEPAEYYDSETDQIYKGIRVAVRVSDGAEDTWKKCADGTYSGFSIGGAVLESENVYNKDLGRTVKVITKYRLTELSLVDNPANELANFETVYKVLDAEQLQKGFSEETTAEEAPEVKADDAADTAADAGTEEEANAEEDADESSEVDVDALIAGIREQLTRVEETLVSKYNDLTTLVEEKLQKIVEVNKTLTEKLNEANDSITKLQTDATATSDRIEKIAGATAMRTSEDEVNESTLEKSADSDGDIWAGVFSNKY